VLTPHRGTPRAEETDDEFRPLTPYLLGRNRVAGAEVIDLRPELAAYFQGVEGGVLVVDVAPQTPAAIAGIIPGDVITHLHQVTVRTVEDLRFGVSQAGATLPITLVRRGTDLQVLLRR
jgi:S1-C subfamily serine protease